MTEEEYKAKMTALAQVAAAGLIGSDPAELDRIERVCEESDQLSDQLLAAELRLARARHQKPISKRGLNTMRKIRITHTGGRACDGSITNAETGEPIERVSRVEVVIDANAAAPIATLHIENVALDFTGNATCMSMIRYDPHDIDSIDRAIARLQAERDERTQQ